MNTCEYCKHWTYDPEFCLPGLGICDSSKILRYVLWEERLCHKDFGCVAFEARKLTVDQQLEKAMRELAADPYEHRAREPRP